MNHIKVKRGLVLFLLLANGLVWFMVGQERPTGLLKVNFLDVGQGDAILIETPSHNQFLIDGGPNQKVLREISKFVPFYDRSLDLVMETHPDTDHVGGLADVLKKYEVLGVVEPGSTTTSGVYREFEKIIAQDKITRVLALKGMIIDLGDEVKIEILTPVHSGQNLKTNDSSILAKLTYGRTTFLLAGDLPKNMENYLATTNPYILKADVYKVSHHGSRESNDLAFLAAIDPKYSIISVGADNRYGHPHPETVEALAKLGSEVFRTDFLGDISTVSDGETLSVDPKMTLSTN